MRGKFWLLPPTQVTKDKPSHAVLYFPLHQKEIESLPTRLFGEGREITFKEARGEHGAGLKVLEPPMSSQRSVSES